MFYFLCLRRLTFFTLNRWYLIGSLLLSFAIPLLRIPVNAVPEVIVQQPVMQQYVMQQAQEQFVVNTPVEPGISWMEWIEKGYYFVAMASVAQMLIALIVFVKRTRGEKLMQIGRIKVLKNKGKGTNGSFMNVVFLNDDQLTAGELQQILAHEMLHVKLFHSADRLLVRLVQVVLWFNPFVYAYIRSIEENHEFEVDKIVARDADKGVYANLLLRLSMNTHNNLLYHSFSKVPLKMRISMLFNKPSSNMKKLIYVLMLPVAVISCLAFANFKTQNVKHNTRVSAVGRLDKLGPHPLVIIDGKEYNDDILYTISGSCLSTFIILPSGSNKYGAKAKDGLVKIKTIGGKILKLTAIEKSNLIKEAAIPQSRFFARLHLKNNDGTAFDKVIFHLPSGSSMSNELNTGEKPAYVLDNKIYAETEMAKLEEAVKSTSIKTSGTGPVKDNTVGLKVDLKGYNNFFYFISDTAKYRQKIKRTASQKAADLKRVKEMEAFKNTDEYKQQFAQMSRVMGKTLVFKVAGEYVNKGATVKLSGYKLTNGGYEYKLPVFYGQEKQLIGQLQQGDEVTIKVFSTTCGKGEQVQVMPATIVKNGQQIFQLVEADKLPQYPFLYEANKVRFTDGQVTSIQKYPNGQWKSAVIEVVNGYKIKFNIKPNAPAFAGIEHGDHVRFRFVNETKTGAKEYTVDNWISISTDVKNYGIKNPDVFFKFYEKA
jgi:hypothetical protein